MVVLQVLLCKKSSPSSIRHSVSDSKLLLYFKYLLIFHRFTVINYTLIYWMSSKRIIVVKSKRHEFQYCFIGTISLLFGIGVLTISSLLLVQSLCKHKKESGSEYNIIYGFPFRHSNWMKSSIPVIVISSFGIVLGSVQILSSLILLGVNYTKFKVLGLVIWLGCHMVIFIFNIICFSLAVSVKAPEHKDSALFWQHYQFQSHTVHNVEAHFYCSLLAANCFFILVAISITASTLNQFVERPISLPPSVY